MKISQKEFTGFKTEEEVDSIFKKAGFSSIYKVAKNNLKIFSEKNYPSQAFLKNLNRVISDNTKKYNKKIGLLYKIGSKFHNLFVHHRFKSTLVLANELKSSIQNNGQNLTNDPKHSRDKAPASQPTSEKTNLGEKQNVNKSDNGTIPIVDTSEPDLHALIETNPEKSLDLFLKRIACANKAIDDPKTERHLLYTDPHISKLSSMCYIAKKKNPALYHSFFETLSNDRKNARLLYEIASQFEGCYGSEEEDKFHIDLKMELYKKASELGSILAVERLFWLNFNLPRPYARNVAGAFEWIKRGAELNDLEFMRALGECLIDGRYQNDYTCIFHNNEFITQNFLSGEDGIELIAPNTEEALNWFKKAAEAGHPSSMAALAKIYLGTYSTVRTDISKYKDLEQGYQWALKAANANDLRGLGVVINCLKKGKGVEKNEALANEFKNKLSKLKDSNFYFPPLKL